MDQLTSATPGIFN
uniref:Uncharacterized protein n=1 Tax=Romanomermis culicivorax TaxID=13658 RepID=A0A915L9Z7_ROMCU